MRWNTLRTNKIAGFTALAGLAASVALLSGCQYMINPFVDNTTPTDSVATASVMGVREEAPAPAPNRQREYEHRAVAAADGGVVHYPLWWEDPFEDRGSNDGKFAWTYEDYVAMPYGLSRFILNTMAIPVTAVVEPPVPLKVSDGVTSKQALGYDHDPEWLSETETAPSPSDDLPPTQDVPPVNEQAGPVAVH